MSVNFSFGVSRGGVSFGGSTAFSDYIHGRKVERVLALTEAEWNALSAKVDTTIYLVTTENGVKLYLGNTSLYAEDIPADVEDELRRLAAQTSANTSAIAALTPVVICTQAEYDAISQKDENTLYVVT